MTEATITIEQLDKGELNKDQLQAEVDRLGLKVEGTGSGGNVVKDDLDQALRGYLATADQPVAPAPAAKPEEPGAAETAPVAAAPADVVTADPRRRQRGARVADRDIYDNGGALRGRRLVARRGQKIPPWYRG